MTVVNVVAAVLMRRQSENGKIEFLLAQRPQDKVYAGYWEFPGGKVESGETHFAALVRELHEELGICIEQAYPWISLQYTYPHATVRLKFFHVHTWHGNIRPIEHAGMIWTSIGDTPRVAPVLPANGPILRALTLPDRCLILCAQKDNVAAKLDQLNQALKNDLKLILIDGGNLVPSDRFQFAEQVVHRVRNHEGVQVMVADDATLALHIGAKGLCLSADNLLFCSDRPAFEWVFAICHDETGLTKAIGLGLDFAILDISQRESHLLETVDWAAFSSLIEQSPIPVFALSPSGKECLETARLHGAHGIALKSD